MTSVQANGITIEYEESGSGEPLLMIMGLGNQLIDWPPELVEALVAHGFRVIRFDNRDSGFSTEFTSAPPTKWEIARSFLFRRSLRAEYSIPDMADDAVGLLDALGIGSAHVVGMSMGGMIAQTIAIEHPTRIRSLTSIMSSTGHRRVGQPTVRVIRRGARRPMPTRENAADNFVAGFLDVCGPTMTEAEMRRLIAASMERSFRPDGSGRQTAAIISQPDRTEPLGRVTVPTLVIHGLVDTLVRPSGGIATAKAIPGARLLMFNDMGHDLPGTRYLDIAEAIASVAARAQSVVRL
jgi:pimeloyl-ACP methyl ester carboxylesterase